MSFAVVSASNGERLYDPPEADLVELLGRLGRGNDVRLQVVPASGGSSWALGVHVAEDSGEYWLFWRDFVLHEHSALESGDPMAIAQRIVHLVGVSAAARK